MPGTVWEQCEEPACSGARLPGGSWCLAHVVDGHVDELARRRAAASTEEPLDVRGVRVDEAVFERVLRAGSRQQGDRRRLAAMFERATFLCPARFQAVAFAPSPRTFRRARFEHEADFRGARFEGEADFAQAVFAASAAFDDCVFGVDAWLTCEFGASASFRHATFERDAHFGSFRDHADFLGARFGGRADFARAHLAATDFAGAVFADASFSYASFDDRLDVGRSRFEGEASFVGARFAHVVVVEPDAFASLARFDKSRFRGGIVSARSLARCAASFEDADFERTVKLPGVTLQADRALQGADLEHLDLSGASFRGTHPLAWSNVRGDCLLDRARFERARNVGPLSATGTVDLSGATFVEPVSITIAAGDVRAVNTEFHGRASLRVTAADVALEGARFHGPASISCPTPLENQRARLVSVRDTDMEHVRLANLDLRACQFAGATGLDKLRTEGVLELVPTPSGHARRRALAEEHAWRAEHSRRPGWYPPECRPPRWLRPGDVVEPDKIAQIYRALRKGLEDSRDEPGAADFYYGEMEMRRHARSAPRSERLVLWFYWLVSGYGLRASRAFTALLLTIVLFALLFWLDGFPRDRAFVDSLIFAAQSTTNLFRAPQEELTRLGEVLQLALRLLGPLFFGLALLSLRGRVKR